MKNIRPLVHLLLLRPGIGTRAIARLADVSHTSACRYLRLLRHRGGPVAPWLAMTEAELRKNLHRRTKVVPDQALHERRVAEGLTLHQMWLEYSSKHRDSALAFTQFAHAMKGLYDNDFIRRAVAENEGCSDERELWARAQLLKRQSRREARRNRTTHHRERAQRLRHGSRDHMGRFAPKPKNNPGEGA
jgi:hypothetical protein